MRRMLTVVLFLCLGGVAGAALMSVQVRTSHLRSSPSFLGSVIGEVEYGRRVNVTEKRGAWRRVSAGGMSGWMHASALTEKRIVLQSGDRDVDTRTSGEELALAGKGFNADVEAEYKRRNADIDFSWIDRMEKIRMAPGDSKEFLADGNVSPPGGAR